MKRIALASAAAVAAAAIGLPSATARTAGPRTFTLVEHAGGLSAVDLPPIAASATAPPSRGDMVVFNKPLTTPGGRRAGTLHAVCTVTQPHRSIETAMFQCDGTYVLSRGQLTFSTAARIGSAPKLTVAVTGGTGAYADARGVIVSTEEGDTATDTFRLTQVR
jgi:allene oxide cyclase-like protein